MIDRQRFTPSHYKSLDEAERLTVLPNFVILRNEHILVRQLTYREEIEVLMVMGDEVLFRIAEDHEFQNEGLSLDSYLLWKQTRPDLTGLIQRFLAILNNGTAYFGCVNSISIHRRLGFLMGFLPDHFVNKTSALGRLRAYVYFHSLQIEVERIEGAIFHNRGTKPTPPGLVPSFVRCL